MALLNSIIAVSKETTSERVNSCPSEKFIMTSFSLEADNDDAVNVPMTDLNQGLRHVGLRIVSRDL